MPTVWLVTGAWRLGWLLLLLTAEAVGARYWWDIALQLPTVERALPMAAVVPPLLAISASGVLVELWPEQMATTARPPSALRAVRFAAVAASGLAAAVVASGRVEAVPFAATAVGVAIAGVLAPVAGRWTWMPLLLASYGWLQFATFHPYADAWAHHGPLLAGFLLVSAAVYSLAPLGTVGR
jgi:hypothetical protein